MSLPFAGQTFQFTQPDGSPITVRGWGNQHHARFETPEGYTVVQNPTTLWWEVARPSPDGMNLEPVPGLRSSADAASAGMPLSVRLRAERTRALARESALTMSGRRCEERRRERQTEARALRHMAARGGGVLAAPPRRGTVGDYVGLCLLVEFPDVQGSIARDEVERFCNQPGYSGFGNSGSVHDYFLDNSLGRCRYTNVVAPYYRAKKQRSYYTDESVEQPIRARELINEALAHWKAQGFDFSALTVDGSNYVYAMNVFYAGPTVNNWSKGLWPHAFHMGTPVPLAGARRAMDYQFTSMGHELTLGTFCHENGHMLCDYPDLYDYGDESGGVGAWCLMCSGANINPKNPTQIGGYLKRLSGWAASVSAVEHDRQFSLKAGANEFALLAKDDKEYFLIEARHKAGRDAALPGEGLAIWHIDEEGSNNFEQMSPARHYECSLEQADGQFEFERGGDSWGDSADLFAGAAARFGDDTTPASRWWDGTPSQLVVDSISPAGSQMQFRCRLGGTTPPAVAQRFEAAPKRSIPDNQASGITETLNLPAGLVVDSLQVEVDITHSWPRDLVATLVPPVGAAIVLHNRQRGNSPQGMKLVLDAAALPALATLRGQPAQGPWQLKVQDLAALDQGQLARWALVVSPAAAVVGPTGPQVLNDNAGVTVPDNQSAGISRKLQATGNASLGQVEVAVDISHPYIGDLRVSLVSPAGTEVVLHAGTGGNSDDIVATYTPATTPDLAQLAGQPLAGNWTLKVADLAAEDVGKLNRWGLTLHPAA